MSGLLGNMSKSKNSVELFLKDSTDKDRLKKAKIHMAECIKYFEDNREDLYLFIQKEESPIFIDYAVVLQSILENYKQDKNLRLKETFTKFKILYDEYYKQLEIFKNKPKIS